MGTGRSWANVSPEPKRGHFPIVRHVESSMATTNPYQAPRSAQDVTSEVRFASRLLPCRGSGVTLGKLHRMQVRALVFLILTLGAGIGYFAWFNYQPGVYVMSGVLAGTL